MRIGEDTVAVVTGAGSGIGRALALELAARGAALALADVQPEAAAETALLARPFGTRITVHPVDVAREDQVAAFARDVQAAHGRVNLLINNAGVALGGSFDEYSLEDVRRVMNINFWGVVYGCEYFLPQLRRAQPAHLVNVSSVFGLIAPPGQSAYCASKFAVRGFSEALRHELVGSGVGLSVVHPGGVRTNIARRAVLPSHLTRSAEAVAREVAEFERSFVTSPASAAATILCGVKRGAARILIGRDARLIDRVQRLFPARYQAVLRRLP